MMTVLGEMRDNNFALQGQGFNKLGMSTLTIIIDNGCKLPCMTKEIRR